ncbi:MAG: lectin-like protein, partial [Desulfobaccales bacterium]
MPEVTSPNTQATTTNEPTLQSPLDPPEVEPNNTLATATTLPLGEDPAASGLFMGIGSGRQDPAGSVWSDPDYWRFEAQAGDVVSISVDTPESSLNPYVELYNDQAQYQAGDDNAGPDNDAFISHYVIPSTGSYYVKVGNYSATPDSYELRVDLARGLQLENDAWYSNDSIAGANDLTVSAAGTQQQATVAGTVMAPEGSNTDEDYFALGTLNVSNQVDLTLRLPAGSTLNGMVSLMNSSGTAVTDDDGNAADGHFLGTIAADGSYYAKVQSLWSYNGHSYLLTDGSLTWSQAEAYAQSLGGHLATVNDAAEQQWLMNTFGQLGSLWIGFYQTDKLAEPAGHWAWMSGETATYTNWASGQPDNYGNNEDYAQFNWDSAGHWNDCPNSSNLRGLIELNTAGGSGAGPYAQYLLDVDVTDLVPPKVTAVTGLPAAGATTDDPVQSFTVSLSEALAPATANAGTRMVWNYDGHFYTLTQTSETWSAAEAEALALSGHLATVNDAAEQQWLMNTVGQLGGLWIGFYQTDKLAEPGGHWAWMS